MRFAIVSDIHANLQAWRVVLTDIAAQRVERIICLGDCIGYGPNPAEVLESLHRHVDAFCLGNHDAAACGKLDRNLFQPEARRLLEWTCGRLSARALRFLATQPLQLAAPRFRCVHGDFFAPAAFNYVENSTDAARSWTATTEPLLFVGHTHVPALFVIGASGVTHHLPPQDFVLEPGKRYLLNPGSVGNPRASDPLASYCIYDDCTDAVTWRTVPFDLDACRAALLAAGFTENDSPFLARDPRQRLCVVREAVCFAPAQNKAQQARGVTQLSELARLGRSARRWRRTALLAGGGALLAAAAALAIALLRPEIAAYPPLITPAAELAAIAPRSATNLLPPFPPSTDGAALAGWRVRLDRPPAMLLQPDRHGMAVIVTGAPARYRIESPPISADRATIGTVRLEAAWTPDASFKGRFHFVIEELGAWRDSGWSVLRSEIMLPPATQTRLQRKAKEPLLVATRHVRLAIEGEHSGKIVFVAPVLRHDAVPNKPKRTSR